MSNAHVLLDAVKYKLKCASDAELARALFLEPPTISKLYSGKIKVGPVLLVNIHEETGISIAELKHLAGLPPAKPREP